jgi:hypothetical protein
MIIPYFASRLRRKEYNWQKLDKYSFRSSLPTGRQVSSLPISEEKEVTGITVDLNITLICLTTILGIYLNL